MSAHDAAAASAALGDTGAFPGYGAGGLGGLAGLFPGLGAGLGKSFNLDVGGGIGGGLGGLGLGGLGGMGGVPYVPVTPLGGYWGFKGDLLVPIVAVGFALFILVVIVLAIKAALAWKLDLLAGKKAGGGKFFRRDASETTEQMGAKHPEENQLNELAHMVLTAIQSQTCAQKVVCDIGTYARERDGLANLLRILESMVPQSMAGPLSILRTSAEGKFDCTDKYPCGPDNNSKPKTEDASKESKPNGKNSTVTG